MAKEVRNGFFYHENKLFSQERLNIIKWGAQNYAQKSKVQKNQKFGNFVTETETYVTKNDIKSAE